jgi:hypothetical protein
MKLNNLAKNPPLTNKKLTTMTKNPPTSPTEKKLSLQNKILQIQAESSQISKLAYNAFQKYYYFTEAQVLAILKPLLKKYNITLLISDDPSQPFLHEREGKEHFVKYLKKVVLSDEQSSCEFSF